MVVFAETLEEAVHAWSVILFILGMFTLPPLVITLIIVGIVKFIQHGSRLVKDLATDEEEEEKKKVIRQPSKFFPWIDMAEDDD